MLRHTKVVLATVLIFGITGGLGWSQITGSNHDFSGRAWSGGQICVACHAPHNAQSALIPLWNHDTTTSVFTLYDSPSFDATAGPPAGTSLACLSCHDGTVAVDAFGGSAGGAEFITGSELVGAGEDLSADHPVSFTYDTALSAVDSGLADPATAASGLGGTIDADLLKSGNMECSSCHDAHNSYNLPNLLVKSNGGSALCLTCHAM